MTSTSARLRAELGRELHDLCQPLTTVVCHLELGQMLGDPESMRAAVEGALLECRVTFESIARMRARMRDLLCDTPGAQPASAALFHDGKPCGASFANGPRQA